MYRRSILAVAAGTLGSLSGCLSTGGSDGPAYEGIPSDQAPDERFDPGEVQRRVSLAGVDPVPGDLDLAIEAELLDGEVTGEDTARLRISTTNTGPERFVSVGEGGCSLFNRDGGESEDGALWLVQPGFPGMRFYGDGERRVDPLWAVRTDDDGSPPRIFFQGYLCGSRHYDPDGSVANEYRVWDGWRASGYMPPGVHRFEEDVAVLEATRPEERDDPIPGETLASFTWGLELRVEDPGD